MSNETGKSDQNTPTIILTEEFKKNLRHLAKKFRSIRKDLDPFFKDLALGVNPGDKIRGTRFNVYKARAKNTSSGKGKSGGFRLIYWLKDAAQIVLLAIYSKTEQTDMSAKEIREIIERGRIEPDDSSLGLNDP